MRAHSFVSGFFAVQQKPETLSLHGYSDSDVKVIDWRPFKTAALKTEVIRTAVKPR